MQKVDVRNTLPLTLLTGTPRPRSLLYRMRPMSQESKSKSIFSTLRVNYSVRDRKNARKWGTTALVFARECMDIALVLKALDIHIELAPFFYTFQKFGRTSTYPRSGFRIGRTRVATVGQLRTTPVIRVR